MYTTSLKLQHLFSTLRDEICGQTDRHYLPTVRLFHAHHAENALKMYGFKPNNLPLTAGGLGGAMPTPN